MAPAPDALDSVLARTVGGPRRGNGALPVKKKKRKGLLVLAAGGALLLVISAAGAGWYYLGGSRVDRADLITEIVRRGTLQLTIAERGTLESANNVDVRCEIKTGTQGSGGLPQIKEVVPDGTLVKAGDTLLVVEDSRFQDQRKAHEIVVKQAYSAMVQAKENLEIVKIQNESDIATAETTLDLAEREMMKYENGDYRLALIDIMNRKGTAAGDLELIKDRAAWAERMVMKGYLTRSQAQAEQYRLRVAETTLDKVYEDLHVLNEYTYKMESIKRRSGIDEAKRAQKRINSQAKAKLVQAETDFDAKNSVWEKEDERLKEIVEEIGKCVIKAKQDGLVVYYVPESSSRSSGGGPRSLIAQGEPVWEGQRLMRIPDLKHMMVNARVHEALISRVKVGQDAQVRVEAFPDRTFRGRVKSVANVAAKMDWNSADVKVYPTLVAIDEEVEGLRPDMSAEVTIFTDAPLQNVLIVPLQALVSTGQLGKQRKCYVLTPDGIEEREVVVGLSNDTHIEIRSGLNEGDEVIVNPRVLFGEKDKGRPANGDGRTANGEDRAGSGPAGPPESRPGAEPGSGPNNGPGPGGQPQTGSEGKSGGRPKGSGGSKKGPPPGADGPPGK